MAMIEASVSSTSLPCSSTTSDSLISSLDNHHPKVGPLHHTLTDSPRSSMVLVLDPHQQQQQQEAETDLLCLSSLSNNHKTMKRRRRVNFAESTDEIIPSASPLDIIRQMSHSNANSSAYYSYAQLHASLWYGGKDLDMFRTQARDACRQMRGGGSDAQAVQAFNEQYRRNKQQLNAAVTPTLALDSLTRGLEQRSCLERQRRKYLAVKCIVRAAQSQKLSPDRLAALSYKCTHWAAELAYAEAQRDYVRAYASDDEENDAVVVVDNRNNHKRSYEPEQHQPQEDELFTQRVSKKSRVC